MMLLFIGVTAFLLSLVFMPVAADTGKIWPIYAALASLTVGTVAVILYV